MVRVNRSAISGLGHHAFGKITVAQSNRLKQPDFLGKSTGFAAIAAAREGLWCPVGTQDRTRAAVTESSGTVWSSFVVHALAFFEFPANAYELGSKLLFRW